LQVVRAPGIGAGTVVIGTLETFEHNRNIAGDGMGNDENTE
jgi:hypothetical protein